MRSRNISIRVERWSSGMAMENFPAGIVAYLGWRAVEYIETSGGPHTPVSLDSMRTKMAGNRREAVAAEN